MASDDTIYQRLASRGDAEGGWTYQQTQKCIDNLAKDIYHEHINTDDLNTNEITNKMLLRMGLTK
ncbi:hypothetical protein PNBC_05660 [Paenibacillus crassostreae]|uniref:Uncharacterized protein n=1 Tax=Paenibacillus crassostreae TaxID=1763538 RepID=A0A167FTH1_9BACL|nr:hypothetical protein LPB68_19080 [Paenibacillus crassostreae]OAB76883.1 hypothetical protein PNBC_05660 [Paenibacillus crassostreae]